MQVKVGTITAPAATGNQNYSISNGGQWPSSATPQLVLLFATGQTAAGTTTNAISLTGAFNATQQISFASASDGGTAVATTNTGQSTRTTVCLTLFSNGTPTIIAVAQPGATRFASNQFSLNWTTVAAGTSGVIIGYVAFSGLSETWMGAIRMPTANGAQTTPVLGSGAQWDAGIFIPSWHTTATGALTDPATTTLTYSRTGIGWAARNGASVEQFASQFYDSDGQGTVEASIGNSDAACLLVPVNNANFSAVSHMQVGALTAFNTDGTLTFNWTVVNNWADKANLAILLRGVSARAGVTLQPVSTTSGTDVAVSGIGVTPKGVFLTSTGQTASGSVDSAMPNNGTAEFAFGVSDGTTHYAFTNINQDAAAEGEARRTLATTKAISLQKFNAADAATALTPVVTSGEATVQSLDATGFTLDWIGQDGTQRRVGYLVFADAATSTQYTSSPTGSIAASGTIVRQTGKRTAGTAATAGALARQAARLLTGSATTSGATSKQTQRPWSSSTTLSSFLDTLFSGGGLFQSINSGITATGAMVKQTARALTGSTTPSGSLAKRAARALTGAASIAGAVVRRTARALTGGVTPTSALASLRSFLRSLTGSVTVSGAVARQSARTLAASVSTAGVVVRQARHVLAASVALSGSAARRTARALTGSVTPSSAVASTRAFLRSLASSVSGASVLRRQVGKATIGTITPTGTATRRVSRSLLESVSVVGSVGRRFPQALASSIAVAGGVVKQAGKRVAQGLGLSSLLDALKLVEPPVTRWVALALKARRATLFQPSERDTSLSLPERDTAFTLDDTR